MDHHDVVVMQRLAWEAVQYGVVPTAIAGGITCGVAERKAFNFGGAQRGQAFRVKAGENNLAQDSLGASPRGTSAGTSEMKSINDFVIG